MADRVQKNRTPFKSPNWLLEAAKKRSGVPVSQALLDRIQHARDHPDEAARKLREVAIRSGRDPATFKKVMRDVGENTPQVRLAQRAKEVSVEATVGEAGSGDQRIDISGTESAVNQSSTPSPVAVETPTYPAPRDRPASPQARPAAQSTERSVPPSPRAQRRVGAKGQITKPTQPRKRNERSRNKGKVQKKPTKSGTTSSASGTASPMDVDVHQSTAESSASGAVREALDAASRTLESQSSSTLQSVAQLYPFPTRPIMPAWYTSVSQQSLAQLDRRRPQEIAAIDALKDCTRRCEQEKHKSRLAKEYNELRNHVHKAEIKLDMDKIKVKKTRILTEMGLPRIFNEHADFPWDLKADAWYLYERWMDEDFEQDILRGIVTVKGKDRNGDRLDRTYTTKHPRDPKIIGNNGTVLGQWWPSQLCAVRDGVHGAAQGGKSCLTPFKYFTNSRSGIYGDRDKGAYSIVLSSGGYHDRDDGDIIEYSGTEGSNFEIKPATHSMITSAKLGNHIRVLRSSQLPKSNKYRPSCGLRYDGLYQIKSYKGVDLEKQIYRFHLERIPGQEPVRFEGVTKRPTVYEEEAYERCKGRVS